MCLNFFLSLILGFLTFFSSTNSKSIIGAEKEVLLSQEQEQKSVSNLDDENPVFKAVDVVIFSGNIIKEKDIYYFN
jgi:hypothetical protein